MKNRLTSLGQGLLAATVIAGFACQGEEFAPSEDEIHLGVALEELGVEVTTCTNAVVDTDFVALTKTLTILVPNNDDAVVSVVGGKLKVNGWQCKTSTGTELTSTNVNKLNINVPGTSKIVFDLLPGTFGNIFGTTGGVIVTDTTVGAGGLTIGVRGTAGPNQFKMAQEGSGATGPFYLELSGNAQADVKIVGNPDAVSFALGDGADTFTAQDQTTLTVSHLGGSSPLSSVNASEPLSIFGGPGADILKGGLGDDTLDGGPDNDTFQTSATNVDDGADIYIGGTGTDTIDYSGRTVALDISIAPTYANGWVEGVNIFDFTVHDTEAFDYDVGGGDVTITFDADYTGKDAILGFLNGASGFNGTVAVASVNDRGELVIVKAGAAGEMTISADDTGLFNTPLPSNNGVSQLATDPDDGLSGEGDDVRADVENVNGGSGNDRIMGSIKSNVINGNGGDDDISGGVAGSDCAQDVDTLNGGDGADMFRLGAATNCADAVDGGPGRDTANYEMRANALTIDIDGSADDGEGTTENDNIKTTVEVVMGGEGGDTITGSANDDELHGGIGADTLNGLAGADLLIGGPGADTMLGGPGNDRFNEKDLDDAVYIKTMSAFAGADIINGGADYNTCDYGRAATSAMTFTLCHSSTNFTTAACTGSNNDGPENDDLTNCTHLIGGAGVDTVTGSDGDDTIEGGAGNDVISGGNGNDTLFGDADDDTLNGNAGEDVIDGGGGTNTIDGGDDVDICLEGTVTACEL